MAPLFLLALSAWLYQPYDLRFESERRQGYETDFGNPPPPGVQVLKARQVIVGDSGGQYLLLKMSPEEIDRHIAKGFRRVTSVPYGWSDGNAPDWWDHPGPENPEYYENDNWPPGRTWSTARACMAVDRTNGMVWVEISKS